MTKFRCNGEVICVKTNGKWTAIAYDSDSISEILKAILDKADDNNKIEWTKQSIEMVTENIL